MSLQRYDTPGLGEIAQLAQLVAKVDHVLKRHIGRDVMVARWKEPPGREQDPAPLDLLVVEGPDRGKRVALGESVEIGRDAGQLPLSDDTISRRHCRVARIADKVYLTDHGSLNGTWLKSGRVQVAEIGVNTLFAVGTYTKIRLLAADSRR